MIIGFFTGASSVTIPSGTDLVRTSGYTVAGEGSALYAYDASIDAAYVVAHPYTSFLSANGLGFRLSEPAIDVKMFGALGNGVTDDAPAVKAALDFAVSNDTALFFPSGSYKLTATTSPTYSGVVKIYGAGRTQSMLVGDAAKAFVKLDAGGSFTAEDLGFDTWFTACALNDNSRLAAFELLECRHCFFDNIACSAISDHDSYTATGGITELRFEGNLCTNIGVGNLDRAAALRIDSAFILSAFVTDNEVRVVGSSTANGQRSGLFLGGASRDPGGTYLIQGNRIRDVSNSASSPGGGGGHISGITAFGRNVRIAENAVNLVQSYSATNTDQYGIYCKSSYSAICCNVLYNAGGAQSTIMCKGMPNTPPAEVSFNAYDVEKVIAHNVIQRDIPLQNDLQTAGICCYNTGHNIHDNNISGLHIGIVTIGPIYSTVDRFVIHHNQFHDLAGTVAYPTVIGISMSCPNRVIVSDNMLVNLGTGSETTVYGINAVNSTVAGNYGTLTIHDNQIVNLSGATASTQIRSINIVCDATAGTSLRNLRITGNLIVGSSRGINIATAGTLSGVVIAENQIRQCTVATISNSGSLTDFAGKVSGNVIDDLPYITPASGSVTVAVFGINHVRTANAAATTITNFTGGINGQELFVEVDANTTIANNANIKLASAWPATLASGTLQFVRNGTQWKESARAFY